MKHATSILILSTLLVVSGTAIHAGETRTLTGEYTLPGGEESGPLEAIFTPDGDEAWSVAFHFTFQGQPSTFLGTARGSLSEGALEGRVQNESLSRTFTFWGQVEDGRFRGSHAEIEDGFEEPTGTMTLAEAGS